MLDRLLCLAVLRRIVVYSLALFVSHVFPLFDASPYSLLDPSKSWMDWLAFPLLRWDAFHLVHLAENGPVYEYEWAFFPGAPFAMKLGASLFRAFPIKTESYLSELLLGGMIFTVFCDLGNVIVLHRLTSQLFPRAPNMANLTTLLSLLSTSPAVLNMAPYSEPIFTFFSYSGMLYICQNKLFGASLLFTLASLCRSNGIFLVGFILWKLLVQPFLDHGRPPSAFTFLAAVVYSAMPLAPFVYHQISAFAQFCQQDWDRYPWCQNTFPVIYSAVQAKYWNSGFLLYWTPQQIPNFIIAGPPLALLLIFSKVVIEGNLWKKQNSPWTNPQMLPQALYTLFMCFILIFASHTQIVLRIGASMPMLYWGAAWLCMKHPRWGRAWVGWSLIWGFGLSVGLWATFLPPA